MDVGALLVTYGDNAVRAERQTLLAWAEHVAGKYPLEHGAGELVRVICDRLEEPRAPASLERREE